jgi:outer membrane protein assembly factor BamB
MNDNWIYVETSDELLSVDIKDRKIKWKFPLSFRIIGEVTKINNLVYFITRENPRGENKLFVLNAVNGKLVWKFFSQSRNYIPRICVEDGILFCGSADGSLNALNAETGDLIWQREGSKEKFYGPWSKASVYQGTVYSATPGKEIFAIDSKTGSVKWEYSYSHSYSHSKWGMPAIVNGALYIRSVDSYLQAISLSDGELLWQFKLGSGIFTRAYSPSVAQDLVFVSSTDNNLYVIGEKSDYD